MKANVFILSKFVDRIKDCKVKCELCNGDKESGAFLLFKDIHPDLRNNLLATKFKDSPYWGAELTKEEEKMKQTGELYTCCKIDDFGDLIIPVDDKFWALRINTVYNVIRDFADKNRSGM